jgi:alpha-galactosidase
MIAIHTRNTSLVLRINDDQFLFHSYYGGRLAEPDSVLSVVKDDPQRVATFEALSVFGGRYNGEPALKATHADGNMTTDLRYQSHEQIAVEDHVTETRIRLKDTHYPFFVTLIYRAYEAEDIIASRVLIENKAAGTVTLEIFSSFDLVLNRPAYWLITI